MLEYNEFKKKIYMWFGIYIANESEDCIDDANDDFEEESVLYGNDSIEFLVGAEGFKKSYDSFLTIKTKDMLMFKEESGEVLIEIEGENVDSDSEKVLEIKNSLYGISYEISSPTLEYMLFVTNKLIKKLEEKRKIESNDFLLKCRAYFIQKNLTFNHTADTEDKIVSIEFDKVFLGIFKKYTLKIKYPKNRSFEDLLSSFSFHYALNLNKKIVIEKDIDRLLPKIIIREKKEKELKTAPQRNYNSIAVEHYILALSSNDTYISYLSFYHILECFYEQVFRDGIVKDLKLKLTSPTFSNNNDNEIYSIYNLVSNKINKRTGRGTEIASLKYLINDHINLEELKNRVIQLSEEKSLEHFNFQLEFTENKNPICFKKINYQNSNSQNSSILDIIANRIYETRNSLVHSSIDKKRYITHKHESSLKKEIPLVRAVAEQLIISMSEILI